MNNSDALWALTDLQPLRKRIKATSWTIQSNLFSSSKSHANCMTVQNKTENTGSNYANRDMEIRPVMYCSLVAIYGTVSLNAFTCASSGAAFTFSCGSLFRTIDQRCNKIFQHSRQRWGGGNCADNWRAVGECRMLPTPALCLGSNMSLAAVAKGQALWGSSLVSADSSRMLLVSRSLPPFSPRYTSECKATLPMAKHRRKHFTHLAHSSPLRYIMGHEAVPTWLPMAKLHRTVVEKTPEWKGVNASIP